MEWKLPLPEKELFTVQVRNYYLLLARVHFTMQVEGNFTCASEPSKQPLPGIPVEVGTNCIKPAAELPPWAHTHTAIRGCTQGKLTVV